MTAVCLGTVNRRSKFLPSQSLCFSGGNKINIVKKDSIIEQVIKSIGKNMKVIYLPLQDQQCEYFLYFFL